MSILAETMAALQVLGDAVTADDRAAYLAALDRAEALGLTEAQIRDAWTYRARKRITDTNLPGVTFNWRGEAR